MSAVLDRIVQVGALVFAVLLAVGVQVAPDGTPRWDEIEMALLLLIVVIGMGLPARGERQ
jgi:hypothetical protein